VRTGLIPDDTPDLMTKHIPTITAPCKPPWVLLVVTDLSTVEE